MHTYAFKHSCPNDSHNETPGRRVRGRTLEPVWSTSSEKGDGRALSGRMGRLSRASLLSNFRTTGALVKPRRAKSCEMTVSPSLLCHPHSRVTASYLRPASGEGGWDFDEGIY